MKVYLNEINGLWAAIDAAYFSKRSWTREIEEYIKGVYERNFDRWGMRKPYNPFSSDGGIDGEMKDMMDMLFRWSKSHITLGKFLDFTFTVEGLHRGAQDDFDSHAKRLDNRIVRSSTRLAKFGDEKSEWYQGKILSIDEVFKMMDIVRPMEIMVDGVNYVSTTNGYVREDLKDNKDVLRGLYPLSIPSNFIFKCNCTEFAHIVNERDKDSHAAPELRLMIEECKRQLQEQIPHLTTEWYRSVKN